MRTSHLWWTCALTIAAALAAAERPSQPERSHWPLEAAAHRAGEALYIAERATKFFWPTMNADRIPLLIFEPGEWAVLVNHPTPPAGFTPAEPLPRFRSSDDMETGDLDPNKPAWSVSVGGADATKDLVPGTRSLGGLPTALVRWNEVSIRSPRGGVPSAEANTCLMVGRLWLAHLEALEPRKPLDPSPWRYEADGKDLALIAVEHRILARMMRINVSEKTLERYKRLFSMWLATRRARLAARPGEVAMEEAIELHEGLADFSETVAFRLLPDPGQEVRPELESQDPFYDRYRGFLIHRVNVLNHPLVWYPADPLEALASARSRGAALAYAAGMIAPKWHHEFVAPSGPARTLREVVGAALDVGLGAEAELLAEAKREEGYDGLERAFGRGLEAAKQAARRLAGQRPAGARVLRVALETLDSFRGSLDEMRWVEAGRIEATGPILIRFPGGELSSDGPGLLLEAGDLRGRGGAGLVVSTELHERSDLLVDGRPVPPSRPGRRPRHFSGSISLTAGRFRLAAGLADLTASSEEIVVRPRQPQPPFPVER